MEQGINVHAVCLQNHDAGVHRLHRMVGVASLAVHLDLTDTWGAVRALVVPGGGEL